MTPAARHQAAIEVLDQIATGVAAEKALLGWARGARYAGSKDRAAVRDIVFDVVRARETCAAFGDGRDGRALVLGLLRLHGVAPDSVFTGLGHAPAPLHGAEATPPTDATPQPDVPEFLIPDLRASLGAGYASYLDVLRNRAPVFLRVNGLKSDVLSAVDALALDGVTAEPHPTVSGALRVTEGARRVAMGQAYQTGLVELQDAASQQIINELPVSSDQRILDYCAGGGGKTLALAARKRGPIVAHDALIQRLTGLAERADRAGADVTIQAQPTGRFDLVLCDVPCSGSGTWRRAPDGKWRLTQGQMTELTDTQLNILTKAAPLVDAQGVLAYATCSVLDVENTGTVKRFLAAHPDWQCDRQQSLHPSDAGDGFFLALLRRR